jgi:hypothetical protein
MRFRSVAVVVVVSIVVSVSHAEESGSGEPEWLAPTVTLGPLGFTPSAHFNGAIGDSSGDPEELAVGHHDPTREDGTVQGIEVGLSLRAGPVEGYAVHTFSYGAEEEWENEWEEAFLKLKEIPGGFELRGGRTLSRFGRHNAKHLHSWDFADMPLVWGRFLGDDGLITDGGDITWLKQGIATTYGITAGYGEAKAHDHAHDHGHDHGHEEGHGEHHAAHGDHGHGEEVSFSDGVGSGRAFAQFRRNDFNAFETGASLALGDDESDRQLVVVGADFSYTRREKGLEPGGRAVTWLTEVLYRDVEDGDAEHGEHEDHGDHEEHEHHEAHEDEMLPGGSEWGLYSQVVYTQNRHLDAGVRIGYVEGDESLASSDRFRVSPAITTYLDPFRRVMLRAQYNYDDIERAEEEHTFWLQAGLSWGGAEVR